MSFKVYSIGIAPNNIDLLLYIRLKKLILAIFYLGLEAVTILVIAA